MFIYDPHTINSIYIMYGMSIMQHNASHQRQNARVEGILSDCMRLLDAYSSLCLDIIRCDILNYVEAAVVIRPQD